jgi:exopolyphosphatase / guanosine-5'-triphosphate,3'-diphosphate pyrophosphatase
VAIPSAERPAAEQTVAFIDIGTNSARLMVVRIDPSSRTWRTISLQKEPVRLGEGEFGPRHALQTAAMDRTVLVCRSFVALAASHGAQTMIAVATAATREADNRAVFVRRLKEEAGLEVHVVSGVEEARLIFLGLLSSVHLGERRAMVIDIGGGSTEVAAGDSAGAEQMDSLGLGALRLAGEFPGSSAAEPVSAAVYSAMRHRVKAASVHLHTRLDSAPVDVVYGTSGTIRNLASAIVRTLRGGTPQREDTIRHSEVRKMAKQLRSLPLEERRRVPGLNPARADIVVAGAAILDALMDELGIAQITAIAECGLREGLLLDYFARSEHHDIVTGITVRERSVLRLGRATSFDEDHARRVAHLALELFDSAGAAGLHDLGAPQRELLDYAALLHDIGAFVSSSGHHRHTYYLIGHADLLGFDQGEIAVIAATALFHRKSLPGMRHAAFAELEPEQREVVRWLSLFVRLAEHLDRGHTGAVGDAALRLDRRGRVVLEVTPAGDWRLERWGLENRRPTFEKALGRELRLSVVGGSAELRSPRSPSPDSG